MTMVQVLEGTAVSTQVNIMSNRKKVMLTKDAPLIAGRICNNFEKNRALYDKSMKLGTWLVDNKTKK